MPLLGRLPRGEVLIIKSAFTLAEVLWMRGGPRLARDKAPVVRKFFRKAFIRVYKVSRKISESAQDLVWDHGIKPKDAIHVATALHLRVDAFETFDAKLIRKSVGDPPLAIREPQAAVQGRLNISGPE